MQSIQARYDAAAGRYGTWWAPVLTPTALRLLDEREVKAAMAAAGALGDGPRVLDVGTGTGALALETIRRWPAASVVGLDGSNGMLAAAATEADQRLTAEQRERLNLVPGDAGQMPLEDQSFDLVVSSFVLQLVRHRPTVLRETRRVLRPGGRFAFVTWLIGRANTRFAPDEAFEDALDELDIDDEEEPEEARSGDFVSALAAARQLRRAGFHKVRAREETLIHVYAPDSYLDFLEHYAERDTFEDLDERVRQHLRDRTAARLAKLRPGDFVWRAPVVYATGIRPVERRRKSRASPR